MTTNHTEEAQNLLDSRITVYGERVTQMERVAKVFSGILNFEVRPDQVPLLMVGYKTVRASQTPDYEDNVKDIEGYAIMFREVIGDDMVAAVNTDEYLLEKNRRAMQSFERPRPQCNCDRQLLPEGVTPIDHAASCPVSELNKHVRAYNGRYDDELLESMAAPLREERSARMQKEVPSYQPGTNVSPKHLMGVYREHLMDIFKRAWKEQGPTVPVERFAEAAAREAVEYFWLTFQRNEQFEASVKESPAL